VLSFWNAFKLQLNGYCSYQALLYMYTVQT
jgi:hypothetical protein